MGDFSVDLTALEGFADQLDQRVAALRSAKRPAMTIPLGGSPAWEGQALFDAYNTRTRDAIELLSALQREVETAVSKARDQARQVRGLDQNAEQNNTSHVNALDGGGGPVA